MRKQAFMGAIVTLVVAMSFVGQARAQSGVSTGSILGTVRDPSGAVIPAAQVTAVNVDTGSTRTLTSQSNGSYQIQLLPPGSYKIRVSKAGFKTLIRSGISLSVDQNLRVDLTLQVGQTTQSVTISGAALQVDTHSSQLSSSISRTQLQELPIAGNRFLAVVNTSPGVIPVSQGYGVNVNPIYNLLGSDAEAAGSMSEDTDYQLDSSDYRLNIWGGSPNMPSSKTIKEVKVVRNSFSAQYGTGSALIVNAVTKSGTNQIHGSVYDTVGSGHLNSRCFTCGAQNPVWQFIHQVGGDIGGPVVLPHIYNGKDKTFFFFDYETFRQPASPSTLSGAFPPTAAERNGDFSALSQTLIDPATGLPYSPRNIIPPSEFDPVAQAIIQKMPTANFGNQLREVIPLGARENQYTVRIDQNFGSKDHLFGRWFWDVPSADQTSGSMLVFPSNTAVRAIRNKSLTVNNNYIFSPTMLNQTSFTWMRIGQLETTPPGSILTTQNTLGIQNWNTDGGQVLPPNFQIPGAGISIQTFSNLKEIDQSLLGSDTLTWIRGRHTIKIGGELGRWTAFQGNGPNGNGRGQGQFTFDGSFTGNGLADFVIGRPSMMTRASSLPIDLVSNVFAAFVQDDFKATRRLTLNLGVRYGVDSPYKSRQGHGGVFIEGQQSQVIPNAPLGLNYIGDPGVPAGFYNTDYKNFGPRVGFAYDPTGHGTTAIRGGFGIYYNLQSWAAAAYSTALPPYGLNVGFVPASLSDPFAGRPNPFPYVFDPKNQTFTLPVTVGPRALDPNIRSAYKETWNLGVQHQVKKMVVEADYVGSEGHHLMSSLPINPARYIPGTDAQGNPLSTLQNIDQRRIILPGVFAGIYQTTDYANSNYQALQVSTRGHLVRNLLVTTAWTWGHSLDNGTSFGRTLDIATSNPLNTSNDKGNSTYDFRHIFTASLVWNLPKFNSLAGVPRTIIGGWALSSLFSAQSGGFATIFSGQDRSLSGVGMDRAQVLLPRSQWINPGTRGQQFANYFNRNAFTVAPIGTFGDSGRNTAQMPGRWVDDLSIMKNFAVTERVTAKFRSDFYNAFNHPNLGFCRANWGCGINASVSSATFGQFWATQSGRTIQFALSIQF